MGPRGWKVPREVSKGSDLGLTARLCIRRPRSASSFRFPSFPRCETDRTVQQTISEFEATYSRVLVFRKRDRSILFATPELLAFVG